MTSFSGAVCQAIAVSLCTSVVYAVPTTIVHLVADDLGYNDMGFMNGGKTYTPNADQMVSEGIRMTSYHTYKVCSPTRASLMTGRYPWGVGYYEMHGDEAVPLHTMMLPLILKEHGNYETHAIGKWNLGANTKEYTPTFRGFDSFFGYYNAALRDYWYHGGGVQGKCDVMNATDLSNSTGYMDADGVQHADSRVNGTYDQELFTTEAVRLINQHSAALRHDTSINMKNMDSTQINGLYIYLAYQNVHLASNKIQAGGPMQAPCTTVDTHYMNMENDTYKLQGAMLTELDYGLGNVSAALKAADIPYVLILVSDNGGPLDHSTNAPLRGGKHTFWDGGVRVVAFVTGSVVPPAQRGSVWTGLAHSSDWYPTIISGIANLSMPATTGPRAVDGLNLWHALLTNASSPRTEVIHQVVNNYTLAENLTDPAVITMGRFKLILGDPGDNRIIAFPAPLEHPVAFGQSGGIRNGYAGETNNCRAKSISGSVHSGDCTPGCLFDLSTDPSETTNLYGRSEYAETVLRLSSRLKEAAATGPPWANPYPDVATKNALVAEICAYEAETQYYEPQRVTAPPPTAPTPSPACTLVLKQDCPLKKFGGDYDSCLACTREHPGPCLPEERQEYCRDVAGTTA
eukprot:m.17077 g.17077  ORF g.17077 m.17077 type:complete len:629 (+) comp11147_c0_seq1:175-2061(+)